MKISGFTFIKNAVKYGYPVVESIQSLLPIVDGTIVCLDAQGFRRDGRKLNVKLINAYIYHYGWLRSPVTRQKKFIDFGKLWNADNVHDKWTEEVKQQSGDFD